MIDDAFGGSLGRPSQGQVIRCAGDFQQHGNPGAAFAGHRDGQCILSGDSIELDA